MELSGRALFEDLRLYQGQVSAQRFRPRNFKFQTSNFRETSNLEAERGRETSGPAKSQIAACARPTAAWSLVLDGSLTFEVWRFSFTPVSPQWAEKCALFPPGPSWAGGFPACRGEFR